VRGGAEHETPLVGGYGGTSVVRVGDTVRKLRAGDGSYVRSVLEHLAQVGFDGATRFLGIDDQGREILSFIQGEVQPDDPREPASEARLISAARLIQSFHAATRGSDLVGPDEVVCHGELGPHNTVFRGDEAVGLIDWDEATVKPGDALFDFGHAVWFFVPVGANGGPLERQARRIRMMCDAYGCDAVAVLDEIETRLRRCLAHAHSTGRPGPVRVFNDRLAWLLEHRPGIERLIAGERRRRPSPMASPSPAAKARFRPKRSRGNR
jgi:hypothetical protein